MIKRFFGLALLCGCLWLPLEFVALAESSPVVIASQIAVRGTIKNTGVAGSCYQLQADDGQQYELMGKFPKRDGLRVQVRGDLAKDVMTICQIGQPLRVKSWHPVK